jgi:hypothetical protein
MFFRLVISILAVCLPASAATIQANSPSRVDVASAVAVAVTGDTVNVPAGLAVWTSNLQIIGKGITLRGAGTNGTIIVDENPTARVNQPSLFDITWQGTNGGMFDLSGFQFRGGTNQTTTLITGAIRIVASNNMTNDSVWRVHGNLWSKIWGRPMQIRAWSGLVDSNYFDLIQGQSGMANDNRIVASEQGDRAWNRAVPWGTTNLVYFEHNQIICPGGSKALIDGFAGSRYVVRYNNILNRSAENHGTESTQRARSGRSMEVYGNTFTHTGGASGEYCVLFRGGSGLVFSNSVVGAWPGFLKMVYFLSLESHAPWNAANGTNVWDLNVAGGPFETGTHTGPDGSADLVDNTKTWTSNQWQQYSVIDYSQTFTNAGSIQNFSGLISGNTSTTITIDPPQPTIEQWTWNTGDIYRLWRVDIGLDAPGRGSGALLSGGNSTTPPTPTIWPGEIDEPIHYWANTGVSTVASGLYPIVAGRDYTNSPLAGYVPLVDPHPLAGGTNVPPPPPPPTMLAFNQQPTTAVENTVITPPVTVLVQDDNGQTVTTSSAVVTIAISANPASGLLSGTKIVAASSGVATFGDLSIDNAGVGYTLSVTSPGLAGRTSASFDITSAIAPPSQLILAQQPTDALTNAVISPPITVKIADANGAQTSSTANVTVSIGANPGGGSFIPGSTLVQAAVNGLATFNDLGIDNFGTNYTLNFVSGVLTGTNSTPFNIYVTPPVPPVIRRPPGPLILIL